MLIEDNIVSRISDEKTSESQDFHIAVSGGADSISLMLLASKAPNINVFIHHVKHNVSPNTQYWADFVRQSAEYFGINVETNYIEHDLHFDSESNFEAEARIRRYKAIFSYMKANDVLMLGHHSDDQVENVLINIFKGRGINGITSLQERSVHANGVILFRPLLNNSKDEVVSYLNDKNIPFVHDESNDESDHDRNFVRNKVVPLLLKRFKPLKRSILSVHKALTNSRVVMEELINDKIVAISDENGIDVADYNNLSKETRTEIIMNLLRREGCYTYNQKVMKEFISQAENIQKNGGHCLSDDTYKTRIMMKSGKDTFNIIFKKIELEKGRKKVFYIKKREG